MPTQTTESPEVGDDGFVRHRCTCRARTVLGSHGYDSDGKYIYKTLWRDRITVIYFGVLAVRCRSCKRWTRVRVLPKEKRAEFTQVAAKYS